MSFLKKQVDVEVIMLLQRHSMEALVEICTRLEGGILKMCAWPVTGDVSHCWWRWNLVSRSAVMSGSLVLYETQMQFLGHSKREMMRTIHGSSWTRKLIMMRPSRIKWRLDHSALAVYRLVYRDVPTLLLWTSTMQLLLMMKVANILSRAALILKLPTSTLLPS